MELYRGAPKRDDDLQEEGNVLEFDFDELAEEAPKKNSWAWQSTIPRKLLALDSCLKI